LCALWIVQPCGVYASKLGQLKQRRRRAIEAGVMYVRRKALWMSRRAATSYSGSMKAYQLDLTRRRAAGTGRRGWRRPAMNSDWVNDTMGYGAGARACARCAARSRSSKSRPDVTLVRHLARCPLGGRPPLEMCNRRKIRTELQLYVFDFDSTAIGLLIIKITKVTVT